MLTAWSLHLCAALSSHNPGEDDVLDAGGLLEALRLYRWQISSFEEQVRCFQKQRSCVCYSFFFQNVIFFKWIVHLKMEELLMFRIFKNVLNDCHFFILFSGCSWALSCSHIIIRGGTGTPTQSRSPVRHANTRGKRIHEYYDTNDSL